ncbi:site-specific DNA-methyltransferase [Corynebacterium lizhenjunii]|uniref:Site-specific DNA-methyltransferase n=1 Tax=Corynebacterium lizhenjunii TaxID=2709394 RepID=A0A7T0KH99_9CORY|nr:site-specific DNA-methyltransferase [Corynebacterium lizhenjunii]QPK80154.1 site-specific DNA-methyltransferase [Corynebacterium lizhenjunii]
MTSASFFGLVWPGKEAARALAEAPSPAEFRPRNRSTTRPAAHRVYVGDNLHVLKHLAQTQPGSVDVIYIDPPYNTGRDFMYRDNFRRRRPSSTADYGRWHADWLSMMLPRLVLARQVLAPHGFICISIGDDECANLRKVADEVFGEDCFAGQLIWKKGGTGKNDSKYAIVEHEYVLVYARTADNPGFNVDAQAHTSTKYNYEDEHGRYSLVRLDSKTLGYLPSLDFTITGPDGQQYRPHNPAGRTQVARWRWSQEKVAAQRDELVFRRGFVYTKNYQKHGARPRSVLDGQRFGVTRTGKREAEAALGVAGVFDFPKPVRLVQHLLALCGGPDAVVLDFFAGSGTTAQAVAELNAADGGTRSVLLAQLPVPTEPSSPARAAGFATLADVCIARARATLQGVPATGEDLPGAVVDVIDVVETNAG